MTRMAMILAATAVMNPNIPAKFQNNEWNAGMSMGSNAFFSPSKSVKIKNKRLALHRKNS